MARVTQILALQLSFMSKLIFLTPTDHRRSDHVKRVLGRTNPRFLNVFARLSPRSQAALTDLLILCIATLAVELNEAWLKKRGPLLASSV